MQFEIIRSHRRREGTRKRTMDFASGTADHTRASQTSGIARKRRNFSLFERLRHVPARPGNRYRIPNLCFQSISSDFSVK